MIERLLDLPLYRLELPTPFPVGPVNVYLVTEPEAVLVDTGPGMQETLDLLEKLLSEAGLRLEQLKKVVVTHGHVDHYGLARAVASCSGAPIYASPRDGLYFSHHQERLDDFYRSMLEQAGTLESAQRVMWERITALRGLAEPLEKYQPIEQLGLLPCGSVAFQPVSSPGHTPGSFCFFEPSQRVLLSSDTVLRNITPNPMLSLDQTSPRLRFPALGAYLESLQRIRQLSPAVIYTGHGEPVTSYPEWHDQLVHHHEKRKGRLLECLRHKEQTVFELSACLFPQARTSSMFLAISEVFAHLDLMEDAGQVCKRLDGPVTMYGV